jgi:transcription elongation factor Elf1
MVVKQFECGHCGSEGKITIKGSDTHFEDIVYCPVCGGDIYEEEDFIEEDE